MRISKNKINTILKKQIAKKFYQTVDDLKDVEEIETFFNNFFNDSELETYIKRLSIAYWLIKGRGYENIKTNLKVSSATIASVEKLLKTPGFKLAIKKMEAEEWANIWSKKIKKYVKKSR